MISVYYNLTRKVYSVMANRRVIDHAAQIAVANVSFRVSEASRQRVIRTKRKAVHAFVCGERVTVVPFDDWIPISYNPYLSGSFVRCDTAAPVSKADFVICLAGRKVFAVNPR
jgi:hypothetical protein